MIPDKGPIYNTVGQRQKKLMNFIATESVGVPNKMHSQLFTGIFVGGGCTTNIEGCLCSPIRIAFTADDGASLDCSLFIFSFK